MKKYIRNSNDNTPIKASEVNPVRGNVCYVNDVDAFDFTDHYACYELDLRFPDFETYKKWVDRFDKEAD